MHEQYDALFDGLPGTIAHEHARKLREEPPAHT